MPDDKLPNRLHVVKPWGSFDQFTLNESSTVKILTVDSGQRLSLQSHQQRYEYWLAVDDGLIAEIDGVDHWLAIGEEITIAQGTRHRLRYEGNGQGRVLEISFGTFDEGDITRYADDYHRA